MEDLETSPRTAHHPLIRVTLTKRHLRFESQDPIPPRESIVRALGGICYAAQVRTQESAATNIQRAY
jgi:hypothetical protein